MTMIDKIRHGLTGSAAVALIAGACAWPAVAQTTTTPNAGDCTGAAANTEACMNNQSPTGQSPTVGSGDSDQPGSDAQRSGVTNPGGASSGANPGADSGTGDGTVGNSGGATDGTGAGGGTGGTN